MISQILDIWKVSLIVIVLQLLILQNIQLGGYISPNLYIFIILYLPVHFQHSALIVLGFILGLIIDIFYGTLGMHAASALLIAFLRPYLLNLIAPRDGYEANVKPSIKEFSFSWFITYALTMTLIHHFTLFLIEASKFSEIGNILLRSFLSTSLTLILIIITHFFLTPRRGS
ncbi:MAG: rod shape-determining protein MreD [Flavobacteriales bacterium]|nr:rod shape-determining protein MreD [Flavobacteriales bacterium]